MDTLTVPYRITVVAADYPGEWSGEQIDAGKAGAPVLTQTASAWYEPGPDGPVEVTDPARIAELDATITQET